VKKIAVSFAFEFVPQDSNLRGKCGKHDEGQMGCLQLYYKCACLGVCRISVIHSPHIAAVVCPKAFTGRTGLNWRTWKWTIRLHCFPLPVVCFGSLPLLLFWYIPFGNRLMLISFPTNKRNLKTWNRAVWFKW